MDASTEELRQAHDALVDLYAEVSLGYLDRAPVDRSVLDRSVLDLFAELVRRDGGGAVADVGCGTGHLTAYLSQQGLLPSGVDLSPGMVARARVDHPSVEFAVADVRDLPYADGSLAGAVCWYSLMFLPVDQRGLAFAELARVVRRGGHLVTAFKAGEGQHRRAGGSTGLGIEFDLWFLSPGEVEDRLASAGFTTVLQARRPAGEGESSPQGYVVARRD